MRVEYHAIEQTQQDRGVLRKVVHSAMVRFVFAEVDYTHELGRDVFRCDRVTQEMAATAIGLRAQADYQRFLDQRAAVAVVAPESSGG